MHKAREMVQRTVMGGGGLPEISDCSEQDQKCEVYLVEEIRQEEQLKQGRDRAFQAILPVVRF
jgi:DNA gyrase subunit B